MEVEHTPSEVAQFPLGVGTADTSQQEGVALIALPLVAEVRSLAEAFVADAAAADTVVECISVAFVVEDNPVESTLMHDGVGRNLFVSCVF